MRVYACTWCVWEIAVGSVATRSTCVRSASEPNPFVCCPSPSHSTSTISVLHLLRCACAALMICVPDVSLGTRTASRRPLTVNELHAENIRMLGWMSYARSKASA